MPYEESARLLNDSLEFTLGSAIKTLLEKKHLYQRIQVDFDTVHEAARRLDSETGLAVTAHADRLERSVNERAFVRTTGAARMIPGPRCS